MTLMSRDQKLALAFLGQAVQVLVDRPLGSVHPKYRYRYPINYGYIPGVISGDGEPLDAYIIGIDTPLTQFKGMVIAVILREDDCEAKLVISADHHHFTADEIMAFVHFQERYFKSRIVTLSSSY